MPAAHAQTMALLLHHGPTEAKAQTAPPDPFNNPLVGAPHAQPAPRCGAPDSDESITFEDMLAGACGDVNAAAAQQAVDTELGAADWTLASEQVVVWLPIAADASGPIDTTVGPRMAPGSWRDPLIDSVFFSDSDGDWDQDGGHRSRRQAAGAHHAAVTAIISLPVGRWGVHE